MAASMAGTAQAALIDRGGGMIYDSTRNITWLADMNYAATSGYASSGVTPGSVYGTNTIWTDGGMGWGAAVTWANNLVYGGYSDWRLPTLNPLDSTGGELSGLFVTDLGNRLGESVLNQVGDTDEQKTNLALFSNVQPSVYWSGTEYAPDPSSAWLFYTRFGYQRDSGKDSAPYAVAVRDGDVPEPHTLALALLSFGAMAMGRRRRLRSV